MCTFSKCHFDYLENGEIGDLVKNMWDSIDPLQRKIYQEKAQKRKYSTTQCN